MDNISSRPWPPFKRSGTTITQRTANDNLDLGSGTINGLEIPSSGDKLATTSGVYETTAISINNGGTGYTDLDVLIYDNFDGVRYKVSATVGGLITGITILNSGSGVTVGTDTVTGGTGNGATINIDDVSEIPYMTSKCGGDLDMGGNNIFNPTILMGGGATTIGGIGNPGGNGGGNGGITSSPYPAGGGGGAGWNWYNAPDANTGGNGGIGVANSITGSSVYYGGGGGGRTFLSDGSATGGLGGGGNAGQPGTPNTGGGAGGGSGSGGSGIVILRWATGDFGTCSIAGTGNTITTSGSDSIATFIVSGDITFVEAGATSTPNFLPFFQQIYS